MRALYWLGFVWALPVTLGGVLLAFLLGARPLPACPWDGRAFCFYMRRGSLAARLADRFGASAWTHGACITYRDAAISLRLEYHEQRHVTQALILGPLFPFAYGACALLALACGGHWYRDNLLEIDAYDHASRSIGGR